MKLIRNISKNERFAVCGFSAVMVVLFLMLVFDDWFFKENGLNVMSPQNAIGQIEMRQNDIRHRSKKSHAWKPARKKQYIKYGDSIFAGKESQAKLLFDKEGQIIINENSLIEFGRNIHQKTMNLKFGKFKLMVDGKVKIAINGKSTTVEGKKAEMQLNLEKDKSPEIKLVEGTASLMIQNKSEIKLDSELTTTLPVAPVEVPLQESMLILSKPMVEEKVESIVSFVSTPTTTSTTLPKMIPIPSKLKANNEKNYIWKFSDLYEKDNEKSGENLFEKRPIMVSHSVVLQWEKPQEADSLLKATILFSGNRDFKNANILFSEDEKITLENVYFGENYYKISFDNENWSSIEKFNVKTQTLEDIPELKKSKVELILLKEKIATDIQIKTLNEAKGFVVQFSKDSDFRAIETKTSWLEGSSLSLEFDIPGVYYYRFRTVNQSFEISNWSEKFEVNVVKPKIPDAPKIFYADREGMVDEKFRIEWDSEESKTVIVITNDLNQEIKTVASNFFRWIPENPGVYFAKAKVKNKYSQYSEFSEPIQIHVIPKPVKISEASKEREPDSIESENIIKIEDAKPILFYNEKYSSKKISILGDFSRMQSSRQYYMGKKTPISVGLGLHYFGWREANGFEGIIKSSVLDVDKDESQAQTNSRSIEARYHRRFFIKLPSNLARELQVSFFLGGENYQNSNELFSNNNNLIKIGNNFEFPIFDFWSGGGEFVYGVASDKSNKKEISGHIYYFFSPSVSFGMGYRLQIFEAVSSDSAPSGALPYKEGNTEGYTIINYHY